MMAARGCWWLAGGCWQVTGIWCLAEGTEALDTTLMGARFKSRVLGYFPRTIYMQENKNIAFQYQEIILSFDYNNQSIFIRIINNIF